MATGTLKTLSLALAVLLTASMFCLVADTADAATIDPVDHTHTSDDGVDWTVLEDSVTVSTVAYYYLSDEVTADITVEYGGTLHLCLYGNTLRGTGSDPVITVNGGVLYLYDCAGVSHDNDDGCNGSADDGCDYYGMITGGSASSGGGVYLYLGDFYMYGGTITGNAATGFFASGGGVNVVYGIFTMYGGTITGNAASGSSYGGGVNVTDGLFTMNGGTISGNSGTYGVELSVYSTCYISGGTVQGTGTETVYSQGTIHFTGGKLIVDSITGTGGSIYLHATDDDDVEVSLGTLSGQTLYAEPTLSMSPTYAVSDETSLTVTLTATLPSYVDDWSDYIQYFASQTTPGISISTNSSNLSILFVNIDTKWSDDGTITWTLAMSSKDGGNVPARSYDLRVTLTNTGFDSEFAFTLIVISALDFTSAPEFDGIYAYAE